MRRPTIFHTGQRTALAPLAALLPLAAPGGGDPQGPDAGEPRPDIDGAPRRRIRP